MRGVVLFLALAAACHHDDGEDACACGTGLVCAGTDAGVGCHTPPMLAMTSRGGPTLASMEVWTVVWEPDVEVGDAVDRLDGLVLADPYFTDNMAEYGVGAGVAKGVIRLGAPPASVDDAFFDDTLDALPGQVSSTGAMFDRPDANTVVTFIVPKATVEPVGTSYHFESSGQLRVPYIVLRQDSYGFVSDFDYLTWTQTHELVEVASDPWPVTAVAWRNVELDVVGEIADLCNDIPVLRVMGGTQYMLTRLYSAARAHDRAGDPCMPALAQPYRNVAISPLNLRIGQSGTVRLHAFSLGSEEAMGWVLYPDTAFQATPSQGTLAPGQEVEVTIRRVGTPSPYPTAMYLYVTDVGATDVAIPNDEWVGGLTAVSGAAARAGWERPVRLPPR